MKLEELSRYKNLELIAKKAVEGFITGYHRSPFTGFSVEFSEHRQYNPGDSTRFIDWKVLGKTDRLYVKRFEEETNLKSFFIIDNSSSMYYPENGFSKIQFSVYASAALLHILQKQRDAFSLYNFKEGYNYVTPLGSTQSHLRRVFTELENVVFKESKKEKADLNSALEYMLPQMGRRALVVLFTDMLLEDKGQLPQILKTIQKLKHYKHEVILFHPLNYVKELELNFDEGLLELEDVESGEVVKVNPSIAAVNYKKQMDSYLKDLKLELGKLQVDYVPVDINSGIENVIVPFLKARK